MAWDTSDSLIHCEPYTIVPGYPPYGGYGPFSSPPKQHDFFKDGGEDGGDGTPHLGG